MLFQPRFLRCFSKSTKLGKFFPVKKDHTISEAFPKQHPKKLQSKNCDLILTEKPPTYITQSKTVPYELYLSKNTLQESPIHSKALDVALIGAPNVGKSSLLNKLTGDNISAVSNKSNTTDEAIKGVYTNIEKRTQIVFYDTPGIIQVYKNTRQYTTVAWDILSECDKALFIVDSTKNVDDSIKEALNRLKRIKLSDSYRKRIRRLKQETESDELTQNFIEEFRKLNVRDEFSEQIIPTYLILNKIDLCTNKRKLRWLINDLEDIVRFEKIHFTSAETGYGTNDLLRALELESFSRPWSFDQNCKSDLSEIQVLEQIIKAAIFERFYKEVPHRVGIQVTEFRVRSDGLFKIEFTLDVENDSQVSMIIGYNGRNLKHLSDRVKNELAKRYNKETILNVLVKKRKENLLAANERVEEILPPGYGLSKAEEELKMLKGNNVSLKNIRN